MREVQGRRRTLDLDVCGEMTGNKALTSPDKTFSTPSLTPTHISARICRFCASLWFTGADNNASWISSIHFTSQICNNRGSSRGLPWLDWWAAAWLASISPTRVWCWQLQRVPVLTFLFLISPLGVATYKKLVWTDPATVSDPSHQRQLEVMMCCCTVLLWCTLFYCLSLHFQSIASDRVLVKICLDSQWCTCKLSGCIRGGFRVQYKRLIIIMSFALTSSLQDQIKGAYSIISKTGSRSQRNIVSLSCMIHKDLLYKGISAEMFFFRHHRTVNSPWCICQAGRGRGRFLDGPYESFQWWSPARLSARSSLPAPALGSPSSSYSGHFEQLKENKGLGLASTMTCKRMIWSSKQMRMLVDWNKIKGNLRNNRTLLLVSIFFLVTF